MNIQGIFHKPKSSFSYVYGEEVHITIKTARGDFQKVNIVWGDKFRWNETNTTTMVKVASNKHFDFYQVSINPEHKRLAYYFILNNGQNEVFYTELGLRENESKESLSHQFFQYPFLNQGDIHQVPQWAAETVFYQIFPERFNNGNPNLKPSIIEKWGTPPNYKSFYGGDLQGIIDKLDYLEDLGIGGIYLTPIFEAPTNHKYDTIDYFKIDPHFGDMDTLRDLVNQCHKRGMKVVLDGVFNHSGYFFKPFQDVLEKGEHSSYKDWFLIKSFPISTNPLSYHTFSFVGNMPKLNTSNKEVKEYLLKVGRYYVEEIGIDGWRLDVADEVDHRFWRSFRDEIKDANPEAYILGEVWHDPSPWLMGDQFDAVMNYPITRALVNFIAYENIDGQEFAHEIIDAYYKNTHQVNEVMLNLLDSHDTSRFLTKCQGNVDKLKLAAVFQMTFLGSPCVYYGTEIGLEGGEDPDCRRTMIWDENQWNKDLYNLYKKIIHIRRSSTVLQRGQVEFLNHNDKVIAYKRKHQGQELLVIINNNDSEKFISLEDGVYVDLYENSKITVRDKVSLKLQNYGFLILERQK
jgi:cyclomaltodextrinase / maltogenic alpha-amylase / neopullulanase